MDWLRPMGYKESQRGQFESRHKCSRANPPTVTLGAVYREKADELGGRWIKAAIAEYMFPGMDANEVTRGEIRFAITLCKLRLSACKAVHPVYDGGKPCNLSAPRKNEAERRPRACIHGCHKQSQERREWLRSRFWLQLLNACAFEQLKPREQLIGEIVHS